MSLAQRQLNSHIIESRIFSHLIARKEGGLDPEIAESTVLPLDIVFGRLDINCRKNIRVLPKCKRISFRSYFAFIVKVNRTIFRNFFVNAPAPAIEYFTSFLVISSLPPLIRTVRLVDPIDVKNEFQFLLDYWHSSPNTPNRIFNLALSLRVNVQFLL